MKLAIGNQFVDEALGTAPPHGERFNRERPFVLHLTRTLFISHRNLHETLVGVNGKPAKLEQGAPSAYDSLVAKRQPAQIRLAGFRGISY